MKIRAGIPSAALSCFAVMTAISQAVALARAPADQARAAGIQFRVRFGDDLSKNPLDGRVLVMLSKEPGDEPRFQISDSPTTQQIFGIDVEGLKPGEDAVIDATALGYPLESLAKVPAGKYRIQ